MTRPDQAYLATLTENTQRYIAGLEAEVERVSWLRDENRALREENETLIAEGERLRAALVEAAEPRKDIP
jgi:hypothetical protein